LALSPGKANGESEAARARSYEVAALISEQASSLNEKRNGMKKLLNLIEYPDRLVHFGWAI